MISTTNTSSKTCIGNVAHQQTARYVNVNIWTRSKALGYNPYSQSLWNAKCLGPTTAEPSEEKFFCAKFFGQTMLGSALRASKKQTTRIFSNGGIEHGLLLQTWRCMTSWLVNCWTVEPLMPGHLPCFLIIGMKLKLRYEREAFVSYSGHVLRLH